MLEEWITYILFLCGLYAVICWILRISYCARALTSNTDLSLYGRGSWALVTGSSDGIGFGFAEYLASQGFNIILIARNQEKLEKSAQSLEEKYPIKTRIFSKDFSLASKSPIDFFQDLREKTNDLDISIIVNNVGFGPVPTYFCSYPENEVYLANSLNIFPVVFITKLFLPRLLERKNRSAFINVSSLGSCFPGPWFSLYSSGKGFIDNFSLIINEEVKYLCRGKPATIDVLVVKPGFVDSPMSRHIKIRPYLISAGECALNCCKALGKVAYMPVSWKQLYMYAARTVLYDFGPSIRTNKTVMGLTSKYPKLSYILKI
ncbi:unnamed protein product [Blepharisma stoltei]|uniref:Uncharacterized protein n=1 Tax=Blepharisma stoltei TaxID=1481888 RepID=A0AAU9KB80_9CILI|nr:unnamed protein product [Blepharisma stoltei]